MGKEDMHIKFKLEDHKLKGYLEEIRVCGILAKQIEKIQCNLHSM
jgi:hypothetical protein